MCICAYCTYYPAYAVTPDLSDTGLSNDLLYRTLCWESPHCALSTLIYPTPGLSGTLHKEQIWLDKQGPNLCVMYVLMYYVGISPTTVLRYVCTVHMHVLCAFSEPTTYSMYSTYFGDIEIEVSVLICLNFVDEC